MSRLNQNSFPFGGNLVSLEDDFFGVVIVNDDNNIALTIELSVGNEVRSLVKCIRFGLVVCF